MRTSAKCFTLVVTLALILVLTTCCPAWFASAEISDVVPDIDQVIAIIDSEPNGEEPAKEESGAPLDDAASNADDSAVQPDTDLSRYITKANHGLFLMVDGELAALKGATFAWGVKKDAALVLHVTGPVEADTKYTYTLPRGLTGKTDGWRHGAMLQYELKGRTLSVRFDERAADSLPLDVRIPMSLKLDPNEVVADATWAKFAIAVSDGFRTVEVSVDATTKPSSDEAEEAEPVPALDPVPALSPELEPDPQQPIEFGPEPADHESDQSLQNQTEVGSEGEGSGTVLPEGDDDDTFPPEGDTDTTDDDTSAEGGDPDVTEDDEDDVTDPASDPESNIDDEDEGISDPSDELTDAAEETEESADVDEEADELTDAAGETEELADTAEEVDELTDVVEETVEETEDLPARSVDVERIIAPILADGEPFELVAHLTGFDGVEPSFLWQYSADGQVWTDVEDSNAPSLTVVAEGGNTLYHWRVLVSAPEQPEDAPTDAEPAQDAPDESATPEQAEPAAPDA